MATWAVITLVFSILATVGSTMAGVFTNAQNQQQARRNEQLAVENREDQQSFAREQQENANRATIEMFNTIDSPAAKVKQLEEAGLSTGLMYGQGGTGGSAHTSAMAGTPSSAAGVNAPFLNPVLSMFKDPTEALKNVADAKKTDEETKKTKAETDKTLKETQKIEEETKTEVVSRNYQETMNKLAETQLKFENATINDRIKIVEENLNLIKQNVNKTRQEVKGLRIDNKYKGQLYQSTLDLNNELQKKYVAETAKIAAEEILIKAETTLTDEKTKLTTQEKENLALEYRKLKVIVEEYEEYGYKGTEADSWASEVIALARYIVGYIDDQNNKDIPDEIREEERKRIEETKAKGGTPDYGRRGSFHRNGHWY